LFFPALFLKVQQHKHPVAFRLGKGATETREMRGIVCGNEALCFEWHKVLSVGREELARLSK
jgi:hypothetical protein